MLTRSTAKRPRGRPPGKKTPKPTDTPIVTPNDTPTVPRRGRGRPRKVQPTNTVETEMDSIAAQIWDVLGRNVKKELSERLLPSIIEACVKTVTQQGLGLFTLNQTSPRLGVTLPQNLPSTSVINDSQGTTSGLGSDENMLMTSQDNQSQPLLNNSQYPDGYESDFDVTFHNVTNNEQIINPMVNEVRKRKHLLLKKSSAGCNELHIDEQSKNQKNLPKSFSRNKKHKVSSISTKSIYTDSDDSSQDSSSHVSSIGLQKLAESVHVSSGESFSSSDDAIEKSDWKKKAREKGSVAVKSGTNKVGSERNKNDETKIHKNKERNDGGRKSSIDESMIDDDGVLGSLSSEDDSSVSEDPKRGGKSKAETIRNHDGEFEDIRGASKKTSLQVNENACPRNDPSKDPGVGSEGDGGRRRSVTSEDDYSDVDEEENDWKNTENIHSEQDIAASSVRSCNMSGEDDGCTLKNDLQPVKEKTVSGDTENVGKSGEDQNEDNLGNSALIGKTVCESLAEADNRNISLAKNKNIQTKENVGNSGSKTDVGEQSFVPTSSDDDSSDGKNLKTNLQAGKSVDKTEADQLTRGSANMSSEDDSSEDENEDSNLKNNLATEKNVNKTQVEELRQKPTDSVNISSEDGNEDSNLKNNLATEKNVAKTGTENLIKKRGLILGSVNISSEDDSSEDENEGSNLKNNLATEKNVIKTQVEELRQKPTYSVNISSEDDSSEDENEGSNLKNNLATERNVIKTQVEELRQKPTNSVNISSEDDSSEDENEDPNLKNNLRTEKNVIKTQVEELKQKPTDSVNISSEDDSSEDENEGSYLRNNLATERNVIKTQVEELRQKPTNSVNIPSEDESSEDENEGSNLKNNLRTEKNVAKTGTENLIKKRGLILGSVNISSEDDSSEDEIEDSNLKNSIQVEINVAKTGTEELIKKRGLILGSVNVSSEDDSSEDENEDSNMKNNLATEKNVIKTQVEELRQKPPDSVNISSEDDSSEDENEGSNLKNSLQVEINVAKTGTEDLIKKRGLILGSVNRPVSSDDDSSEDDEERSEAHGLDKTLLEQRKAAILDSINISSEDDWSEEENLKTKRTDEKLRKKCETMEDELSRTCQGGRKRKFSLGSVQISSEDSSSEDDVDKDNVIDVNETCGQEDDCETPGSRLEEDKQVYLDGNVSVKADESISITDELSGQSCDGDVEEPPLEGEEDLNESLALSQTPAKVCVLEFKSSPVKHVRERTNHLSAASSGLSAEGAKCESGSETSSSGVELRRMIAQLKPGENVSNSSEAVVVVGEGDLNDDELRISPAKQSLGPTESNVDCGSQAREESAGPSEDRLYGDNSGGVLLEEHVPCGSVEETGVETGPLLAEEGSNVVEGTDEGSPVKRKKKKKKKEKSREVFDDVAVKLEMEQVEEEKTARKKATKHKKERRESEASGEESKKKRGKYCEDVKSEEDGGQTEEGTKRRKKKKKKERDREVEGGGWDECSKTGHERVRNVAEIECESAKKRLKRRKDKTDYSSESEHLVRKKMKMALLELSHVDQTDEEEERDNQPDNDEDEMQALPSEFVEKLKKKKKRREGKERRTDVGRRDSKLLGLPPGGKKHKKRRKRVRSQAELTPVMTHVDTTSLFYTSYTSSPCNNVPTATNTHKHTQLYSDEVNRRSSGWWLTCKEKEEAYKRKQKKLVVKIEF